MGAKTWMVVHAEGDTRSLLRSRQALDESATRDFVARLFPGRKFRDQGRGDLSYTNPPKGKLFAGSYPSLRIAASIEFGKDYPSKLPAQYIAPTGTTYLHAMHSVVDWFAFAVWENGILVRALSLSPDSGILEDIGDRLAFEHPFWDGKHPAVEPDEDPSAYPFPFHPLELGEAALKEFFGYQLEGFIDPELLEPEHIPLLHFIQVKPWWRFW